MALGLLTLPFTQEGEVTHVDPGLPRPIEKKFLKRNFLLFFNLSREGNLKQQHQEEPTCSSIPNG
jgi:hypothetical protein